MMTKEVLEYWLTKEARINVPPDARTEAVVIESHLEALAEIERLRESEDAQTAASTIICDEIERLKVIIKDDQFVLKLSDDNFLLAREQVDKLREEVKRLGVELERGYREVYLLQEKLKNL